MAYAVDLWGVTHATYELECDCDDDAKRRAVKFLEAHPVIEVWSGPRRVARFTADTAGGATATAEANQRQRTG